MNDRYDNAYTCKISCNAVHVKFEVNDFESQFDMHMMQAQLKKSVYSNKVYELICDYVELCR